ncbi:hypothetical protein [Nautilia sp.]
MLKENDILKLYKRAKREKKERLQKNFNNIRIDIRFSKKSNSYNVNIFIYKNKKYEKIGTADIVIVNNNYKIKNLKKLNKAINEFLLSEEEKKEEPLSFSLYIEDFLNYIDTMNIGDSKKRQKKKYVINNLKTFLENNSLKDEKNIVNYLNYCIRNAKSFGVSKTYNSNNCYTLKNNMTILKEKIFLNFCLSMLFKFFISNFVFFDSSLSFLLIFKSSLNDLIISMLILSFIKFSKI